MKNEMNRREFLMGATASLFAAGGCRLLDGVARKVAGLRIGVQMWSVDDLWTSNPIAAFRRLRAMGYTGVQSFGFCSMDWNELEKMLDGEGLQIVDMPFYMETLAEDEPRFLDFCARFGINFAFEPSTDIKTGAAWARHTHELVDISRRFAGKGIRVGFHNHQGEVRDRYDGKSPMDYLCEAGLSFELDVGHLKLAGGDPVSWLKKLGGRVPTIHAKPSGGNFVGAPDDSNDWQDIFAAASDAGTKWAVVECETRRNTYEDVELTMKYLKGLEI